jgi:hypothetical protein
LTEVEGGKALELVVPIIVPVAAVVLEPFVAVAVVVVVVEPDPSFNPWLNRDNPPAAPEPETTSPFLALTTLVVARLGDRSVVLKSKRTGALPASPVLPVLDGLLVIPTVIVVDAVVGITDVVTYPCDNVGLAAGTEAESVFGIGIAGPIVRVGELTVVL